MKKILFTVCLLLYFVISFCQSSEIDLNLPVDSLRKFLNLQFSITDSNKVNIENLKLSIDSVYYKGEYSKAIIFYSIFNEFPEAEKFNSDISEKINLSTKLLAKTTVADSLLVENKISEARDKYNVILQINKTDKNCENRLDAIKKIESGDLIFVQGCTFTMGSPEGVGKKDEHPQREITLSNFYISKTEVTNQMFADFLNAYGSDTIKQGEFIGETMVYENETGGLIYENEKWIPVVGKENYPAIYLNYYGAYEFCNYYGYKLPSEAQWEYAARGGINWNDNFKYSGSNKLKDIGWFYKNSKNKENPMLKKRGTHEVALLEPNQLGIYDMTGNVREICMDYYSSYKTDVGINPVNLTKSQRSVSRGGSWNVEEDDELSITARYSKETIYLSYVLGFRYVLFP